MRKDRVDPTRNRCREREGPGKKRLKKIIRSCFASASNMAAVNKINTVKINICPAFTRHKGTLISACIQRRKGEDNTREVR